MKTQTLPKALRDMKVKAIRRDTIINYYTFDNTEVTNNFFKQWLNDNKVWEIENGVNWKQYGTKKFVINYFYE